MTARRVNTLLQSIRQEHGPIRGIIHGAGVLADRLITDKTREQFAMVYGTKVSGLRSLLEATSGDDLRFIVLFGSTTGRFGRSGQVDYAVANEVLNKLAQAEARRRANCRCVSINWGPWDGGMVTPAPEKGLRRRGDRPHRPGRGGRSADPRNRRHQRSGGGGGHGAQRARGAGPAQTGDRRNN